MRRACQKREVWSKGEGIANSRPLRSSRRTRSRRVLQRANPRTHADSHPEFDARTYRYPHTHSYADTYSH